MSSTIHFIARHHGVVTAFETSGGALAALYDPLIYAGDSAALHRFIDYARDKHVAVPQEPGSGVGLVAIDLDTKTQWDWQWSRPIRLISLSLDGSWLHVEEWLRRGWFGAGLVEGESERLLHPFPASYPRGMLNWYLDLNKQHAARFGGQYFKDFVAANASAPRLRIEPPGWTFETFEEDELEKALSQVQHAGLMQATRDPHEASAQA